MCGRYTLTVPGHELVEIFDVPAPNFEHSPRYNIAPTQFAPVIARDRKGTRMGNLRWGLIPPWAEDPSVASKMINARGETLLGKPSFREAARDRRCLVPVDGFYEWTGTEKPKQPHWIHRPDQAPMTFAGLWERWRSGDDVRHTFTIVTVDAAPDIRHLHHRMPAIVGPEDRETWLGGSVDDAMALLRPTAGLTSHPVERLVNSVRNEDPALIEPLV